MATVLRQKTKVLDNLNLALKDLEGKVAKVGWFESSTYEDGTPVAYIASIHELGCPDKNIPPRPTMRPAADEKRGEWADVAEEGAKAILRGSITATGVMDLIGQRAAGDVSKNIAALQSPPLKPATIAARRRRKADKITVGLLTKPLIDTGHMFNTLTSKVEDSQ